MIMALQMKKELEYNLEALVERSNIYKEDGFIVNSFAVNSKIGKVAVLRRHDKKNASETRGLCKIEFYSTIDMPKMYFEKSVVIQETLVEGIAWIALNTLACVCLDGSVVTLSPYSTAKKRHQISATPFWCAASYSPNEVVAGTDSGNVFLLKQEQEGDDVIVKKQFSVGTDQRSLTIAASGKLGLIAVGCLDKVYIINANAPDGKSITIQMQREHRRATIAWSLLFLGPNLFIGDSRGNVNIFNNSNGALIKNIPTHQSSVLSLAADGETIYASGVDYRIQCIRQVQDKNDWITIGQRIIHENDVRAMAFVDNWLISGGAEHDILISKQVPHVHRPIKHIDWSISDQLKYQLIPTLFALTIVERRKNSFDQVIPAKTVGVSSKNYAFEKSALSPNGLFVVASTCKALKIYAVKPGVPPRIGKMTQISAPGVVTSIVATNEAVFYAVDDFELRKVDYKSKQEKIIFKTEKSSSVRKLLLSPTGNIMAALTYRNEILFFDLSNNTLNENSKGFHQYAFKEPIIDFCWNDQRGLLILSTTRNPFKLLFLNGKMQNFPAFALFEESINDKNVAEYPVAISSIVDRRLIVISNLSRYTVLEFDTELKGLVKYECGPTESAAPSSTTTTDAKTGDNEVVNSKSSRMNRFVGNSRLTAQWAQALTDEKEDAAAFSAPTIRTTRAQERKLMNGHTSSSSVEAATKGTLEEASSLFGKQRIFLCGTEPESPPTQVPFVIKRFNRN